MWRTGKTPKKIRQETFCHHYNSVSYHQHGGTLSHITSTFYKQFCTEPLLTVGHHLRIMCADDASQIAQTMINKQDCVQEFIIMLSDLNNNWSWFTVKALLSPTKIPPPPPPLHVNRQRTSVVSQLTVCSNKPTHSSSDTVGHFQLNASWKDLTFRNIVMINS